MSIGKRFSLNFRFLNQLESKWSPFILLELDSAEQIVFEMRNLRNQPESI